MIKKLTWMITISLITIFSETQTSEAKFIFSPVVDASLSINTAKYDVDYATETTDADGNPLSTTDESTSQNAYLYVAPNFAFTELPNLWITPSVEFEYYGSNNLLNIEDEAFIFSTTAKTYALLGGNYRFNRTWQLKLKGFGRLELNKSANDETLETGYYTYNDLGLWTEIRAMHRLFNLPIRSKIGLKTYHRRYPNATNAELVKAYEAAGFDTTDIPKDLHDKDINVNEGWIREELTWGSLPILTNFELHFKDVAYREQQLAKAYDTFSGELRHDRYLDAYLEFPFLINKYNQFEIDYGIRIRQSNQNYHDFSADLFFENYYDYLQQRIRLLYNFGFAFKITGYEPKGSVSYSYQHRYYPARPSKQKANEQDTSGTYMAGDPHQEGVHDFGVTIRQTLFASWFNLFISFHTISQESNTTVEDSSSYNYKYNTFTLGTAFQF